MLPIPPPLQAQFEDHLRKKAVPKQNHFSLGSGHANLLNIIG